MIQEGKLMSEPFFDEAIRNELLELMSPEDLKGMDQELHGQLSEMPPELEAAYAAADWSTVYQLAHKVAGASEMLGAAALGGALRRIEAAAMDNKPGDMSHFQRVAQEALGILAS